MQHCFEANANANANANATAASTANDRIVVTFPDGIIVVGIKNEYFVC